MRRYRAEDRRLTKLETRDREHWDAKRHLYDDYYMDPRIVR